MLHGVVLFNCFGHLLKWPLTQSGRWCSCQTCIHINMCQVGSSLQMYPERDGEKRLQEKWCRSEKTHIQSNHTIGNVSTILLMTLSTIYFYFGKPNFKESFFSVGKDKILDLTPAIKCLNRGDPSYRDYNCHEINMTLIWPPVTQVPQSPEQVGGGGNPSSVLLPAPSFYIKLKGQRLCPSTRVSTPLVKT